ncbi:MAG: hypothetical protein WC622_16570 [Pedobacter sp.]|jgi:hypothetical protein|uniref:hypothetical protein n=1 Tax=Pedobacter sp. TaxID=1411316 RepID=UPI003563474B
MNILEELKTLQQQFNPPEHTKTGDSYISDAVTYSALYRAGCDESVINDVLLEPVEKRSEWIAYFENLGVKK